MAQKVQAGYNDYSEWFSPIIYSRLKVRKDAFRKIAKVGMIPGNMPKITRRAQRFYGGARTTTDLSSDGKYSHQKIAFDKKGDMSESISIDTSCDRGFGWSPIEDTTYAHATEVARNQIRASQMSNELISATQGFALTKAFDQTKGAKKGSDIAIDTSDDSDVKKGVVNILTESRIHLDTIADDPLKGGRISVYSTPAVVSLMQRYALIQGGTDMENRQMSGGWSTMMNNTEINSSNEIPLKVKVTFGVVPTGTEWQFSEVHPFRPKFVASLTGAVNEVKIGTDAAGTAANFAALINSKYNGKVSTVGSTHGRLSNISASSFEEVNEGAGYTLFRDGNLTFADVKATGAAVDFTVYGVGRLYGDTQPFSDGTGKAKNPKGADISTITLTSISHGMIFTVAPIVTVYYSSKLIDTVVNSQLPDDATDFGTAYLHDMLEQLTTRFGAGVWSDDRRNGITQFITLS